MKNFLFVFFLFILKAHVAFSQTPTSVETTLLFNENMGRYEVFARFNQNGPFSIGTSVISVILPASAADNPLNIIPINGGGWANTSNSYNQPDGKDYKGVVTSGQSNMPYGVANTEILLFAFTVPGGGCLPGVRLWTSSIDVDQTNDGTEYSSNIYTPANNNYLLPSVYGIASPSCCFGTPTCHTTTVVKN